MVKRGSVKLQTRRSKAEETVKRGSENLQTRRSDAGENGQQRK